MRHKTPQKHLFAIKNLTLSMKKDRRQLVKDFSFTLGPENRKVALIGEEGNGKSTLLKAIYDPQLVHDYIDLQGNIEKAGEIIGYLPQQTGTDWHTRSAMQILQESIPWEHFDYALYYATLAQLGLQAEVIEQNSRALDLSGGEKIKFQLLLAMLRQPTLLLLDEPTNDLDLTSIALMERFILDLTIPVIFVSHDEHLLERCADTIIHFEQLLHKTKAVHTIASLGYRAYLQSRSAALLRQTRQANKEKEIFDQKIQRYQQQFERVQHELRAVSRQTPAVAKNLKDKMHSVKAMGKRFERERDRLTPKPLMETAIELSFDSDLELPGKRLVLDFELAALQAGTRVLSRNIRLTIRGPEKICIVGANGAGKTTLLRLLMARLEQQEIPCGYMPQMYDEELEATRSPVDFLTREHTKAEHTRIRTYLGSLNFTAHEMLEPIGSLSGGQKAKLYFAKMIFERAHVLILDEPTRNVSPLSGPEIRQALCDYKGGILAVSHDRAFIEAVFSKVYRLDETGLTLIRDRGF